MAIIDSNTALLSIDEDDLLIKSLQLITLLQNTNDQSNHQCIWNTIGLPAFAGEGATGFATTLTGLLESTFIRGAVATIPIYHLLDIDGIWQYILSGNTATLVGALEYQGAAGLPGNLSRKQNLVTALVNKLKLEEVHQHVYLHRIGIIATAATVLAGIPVGLAQFAIADDFIDIHPVMDKILAVFRGIYGGIGTISFVTTVISLLWSQIITFVNYCKRSPASTYNLQQLLSTLHNLIDHMSAKELLALSTLLNKSLTNENIKTSDDYTIVKTALKREIAIKSPATRACLLIKSMLGQLIPVGGVSLAAYGAWKVFYPAGLNAGDSWGAMDQWKGTAYGGSGAMAYAHNTYYLLNFMQTMLLRSTRNGCNNIGYVISTLFSLLTFMYLTFPSMFGIIELYETYNDIEGIESVNPATDITPAPHWWEDASQQSQFNYLTIMAGTGCTLTWGIWGLVKHWLDCCQHNHEITRENLLDTLTGAQAATAMTPVYTANTAPLSDLPEQEQACIIEFNSDSDDELLE